MKKHGYSNTPGYQSWDSMLRRCTDTAHKDYPNYGGRGITVAPLWHSVAIFFQDMGPQPQGKTLDRKNNSLGYFKENCRWATPSEQTRNQRKSRRNTSGCSGVSWQQKQGKWLVSRMLHGNRKTLYWGLDFFEACCAAKSWEVNRDRE